MFYGRDVIRVRFFLFHRVCRVFATVSSDPKAKKPLKRSDLRRDSLKAAAAPATEMV